MRVYFNKEVVGKSIPDIYHIGREYKIFRYAEMRKKQPTQAEAWLIVRFQLKHMSGKLNKLFSVLPMIVLFRFKGFRSKYWLVDEETNTCMGVYRWQTLEDAKRYSKSIAMEFMSYRSTSGSVKFCLGEGEKPICEF